MSAQRPALGAALLIGAMACFAVSDALAKQLTGSLSPLTVTLIRYAALALSVLPVALARPRTWRSSAPLLQAARAAAMVGSAALFLTALQRMPVPEATAMVFASPMFTMLLAMLVLRERLPLARWLPVFLSFAGVLLVVRPASLHFRGAELFPLASSVAWAVAVTCTRRLSALDSLPTTMLYSALFGSAGLALAAPWPEAQALRALAVPLAAMAIVWCGAQWLSIAAYRLASPGTIAPFAYVQLLWAGLIGWLIFDHLPDAISLAGMAVIVAGGLWSAWATARR